MPLERLVLTRDELEKFASMLAMRVSEATPNGSGITPVAWADATLHASRWFTQADVSPVDAAMLLCDQNPDDDDAISKVEAVTTEHTNPKHFRALRAAFQDLKDAEPRATSLETWVLRARALGLHYHPWVDAYLAGVDLPAIKAKREAALRLNCTLEEVQPPNPKSSTKLSPVNAEPKAQGNGGKRWTEEALDELREYRRKHGTKEAAKHFGVSAARVRGLLPSGNAALKGYSAFTQGLE